MEKAIKENLTSLCEYTDVNEELLIRLLHADIILQGFKDQLKHTISNFERASKLYAHLPTKSEEIYSTFKAALHKSGNTKALAIFENSSKPENQTNTTMSGASSIPIESVFPTLTTLPKPAKVSCSNLASVLAEDEQLLIDWKVLPKKCLNSKLVDYIQKDTAYKHGTEKLDNIFSELLSTWVSKTGKKATIGFLVEKFKELEFEKLADLLLEKYSETTCVVQENGFS